MSNKNQEGQMTLAIINSLLVFAAAGFLFYSRIYFKRPLITESSERARLESIQASPAPPAQYGTILFDPVVINIESSPVSPKPADGTTQQILGKLHYVTVGFALEIRDQAKKELIENIRPVLMDKLLSILGHRSFHDLATVQGRYLLRTQIMDIANRLVAREQGIDENTSARGADSQDNLVTNVFFTTFLVQ